MYGYQLPLRPYPYLYSHLFAATTVLFEVITLRVMPREKQATTVRKRHTPHQSFNSIYIHVIGRRFSTQST